MTITSYPYEGSGNGFTNEARWRAFSRLLAPTGVALNGPYNTGRTTATGGLNWSVESFTALVDGTFVESDTAITGTVSAGPVSGNRIDTLVLERNLGTNASTVFVVPGSAATTPVAPTLTQDATTWQMPLADLRVNQGTSTIASVTDRRPIAVGIDGSSGGRVKLSETILTSATAAIDVQNIPQSFRELIVDVSARSNRAAEEDGLVFRMNNDSANNYSYLDARLVHSNSVATSEAGLASANLAVIGDIPGNFQTAADFAMSEVRICDYSSTTKYKLFQSRTVAYHESVTHWWEQFAGGMWGASAFAVNRLRIFSVTSSNLSAGTRVTIYGIR